MQTNLFSSRAFSLPKNFFIQHLPLIKSLNDNILLNTIFDNNRYVKRERIQILTIGNLEMNLFKHTINIEYKAMIHSSNNVVIIANITSNTNITLEEIEQVINNWIPKENIFSNKKNSFNIRNILNYGFGLFLSKIYKQQFELLDFISLNQLNTYVYEDKDIQEIEKIYKHFELKTDKLFFIPTMYGTSFNINKEIKQQLVDKGTPFIKLNDSAEVCIERNYAYIIDMDNPEKYIYAISFFNLLKHLKNRISCEISIMFDDVHSINKSDYSELLEQSLNLQKELTINYDEFNNINIWHDTNLLSLSKIIRTKKGWNIAEEFSENKTKIQEFIELTTEMSKGKLQSFMDSISLLIGVLGVFAIFDLIQILNQEPYTGLHWLISFISIIILLPIFLIYMAKKSSIFMKLLNKML